MRPPDTLCDQRRDIDSFDHTVGFFDPGGLINGVGKLQEEVAMSIEIRETVRLRRLTTSFVMGRFLSAFIVTSDSRPGRSVDR